MKQETKRQTIRLAFAIYADVNLLNEFKKLTKSDEPVETVISAIQSGFASTDLIDTIKSLVSICFKINGRVFLCAEKATYDGFEGSADFNPTGLYELHDMSYEMERGDSSQGYSFYVSHTHYFELATVEEILAVKKFLTSQ